MESPDPAAPGKPEPLAWETLVAEGRAAGQDPAGLTFPGSRAGLEAVFPVRKEAQPLLAWHTPPRAAGGGLPLHLSSPNECRELFTAKWAVMAFCGH